MYHAARPTASLGHSSIGWLAPSKSSSGETAAVDKEQKCLGGAQPLQKLRTQFRSCEMFTVLVHQGQSHPSGHLWVLIVANAKVISARLGPDGVRAWSQSSPVEFQNP